MALDLRMENGFRVISFEYIGELDSYFMQRLIIIKYRSSSITDKIHKLLSELWPLIYVYIPGGVAQSVTCLATDACLTADPGIVSSILVRSHTFVEIDHEIISTVILLPSADLFKKGCCQLQAKVCAQITG